MTANGGNYSLHVGLTAKDCMVCMSHSIELSGMGDGSVGA